MGRACFDPTAGQIVDAAEASGAIDSGTHAVSA
jgi:hypothetical protein